MPIRIKTHSNRYGDIALKTNLYYHHASRNLFCVQHKKKVWCPFRGNCPAVHKQDSSSEFPTPRIVDLHRMSMIRVTEQFDTL